jgi:hypothetical protein
MTVDGAEQSVVGAEAANAPGNPVNRVVGVPFEHRVNNSVLRGGQTPRIEAPVGPLSGNLTIA